jgi:hypothetical protein
MQMTQVQTERAVAVIRLLFVVRVVVKAIEAIVAVARWKRWKGGCYQYTRRAFEEGHPSCHQL